MDLSIRFSLLIVLFFPNYPKGIVAITEHRVTNVAGLKIHLSSTSVLFDGEKIIKLASGSYHHSLDLNESHSGLQIHGEAAEIIGFHRVTNVKNVQIHGVQLRSPDESGPNPTLTVKNGQFFDLIKSVVRGGVHMDGGSDNVIRGNRISNQGGNCVTVYNCGDVKTLSVCNTVVENNVITDCFSYGPYVDGSAGVLTDCTIGLKIRHNYIARTYSWGIRLNNNNYCPTVLNEVSYNHVEDWGLRDGDGSCMYTYGHWFSPGNTFTFNYCLQNTQLKHGGKCLYIDDASSGQNFTGNICHNTGLGVEINGGHFNQLIGNIFINNGYPMSLNCRGLGFHPNTPSYDWYSCANMWWRWGYVLEQANYLQEPWISHWPWYKGWCNSATFRGMDCDPDKKGYDCFAIPTGNVNNNNAIVMYKYLHPIHWSPCNICPSYVCEQDFNTNGTSFQYKNDPGFVDYANGDLTLRSDSSVYRDMPDFPRYDFRNIGPQL